MPKCGFCQNRFNTRQELANHQSVAHNEQVPQHCFCSRTFDTAEQLAYHQRAECLHPHSRPPRPAGPRQTYRDQRRGGRGGRGNWLRNHIWSDYIDTYVQPSPEEPQPNNRDPLLMRGRGRAQAREQVAQYLLEYGNIKVNIVAVAFFNRPGAGDEEGSAEPMLHLTQGVGALVHNLESWDHIYEQHIDRAAQHVINFEERGSGFTIHSVGGFWLNIFRFPRLAGGSYLPTPSCLKKKMAVINVMNRGDHDCFQHALGVAMMIEENPQYKGRIQHPTQIDPLALARLDLTGVTAPVLVQDLTRVEAQNPSLAINVLLMHEKQDTRDISVLRVSPRLYEEGQITVNLLLLYNDQLAGHYVYVRHLNRLMASIGRKKRGSHWCIKCQHYFGGQDRFEAHLPCHSAWRGKLTFPKEDIRFKGHMAQMRQPWVVYADFESKLVPMTTTDTTDTTTTTPPQPEPKVTTRSKSYREFLQKVAYPDWHQGEGEPSQVFLQTVANPDPHNNHQPDPTWHPQPTPQPTREGPAGGRAQAGPAAAAGRPGGVPKLTKPAREPKKLTGVLHQHEGAAYTLAAKGPQGQHFHVMAWTGPGVKERLVRDLYRIQDLIQAQQADRQESELPMMLTAQDEAAWQAAQTCFLCHEPFGHPYLVGLTVGQLYRLSRHPDKKRRAQSTHPHKAHYVPSYILKGPKVRDHNHDTGAYRGAAHRTCNLNFRRRKKVPIFFHNGSR